jgi:hypothetical protein
VSVTNFQLLTKEHSTRRGIHCEPNIAEDATAAIDDASNAYQSLFPEAPDGRGK